MYQLKGYVPSVRRSRRLLFAQRDLCDLGIGVMEYWDIGVTPLPHSPNTFSFIIVMDLERITYYDKQINTSDIRIF